MKISEATINKIKEEAKKHFKNLGPSHDWSHVERVIETAVFIAKREGADLGIIKIAAYLHDIGRISLSEKNYDHAVEGAKMAKKILSNYPFSKIQINNICHSIEAHRFRNKIAPKTIEAKCLHDADKLDVLGALGIARSYIYLGETGDCVIYTKAKKKKIAGKTRTNSLQDEYEIKYRHLPKKMTTRTGKIIAQKRLKYMGGFIEQLEKEARGKA